MDRKPALILAFLLTGLIVSNLYLIDLLSSPGLQSHVISRVIDGDTVELEDGRKVRLLNINTPEKSSPLSKPSIDYMKKLENSSVLFEFTGKDKYQRSLARIYSPSYLNLELVEKGLASKYLVSDNELDIFSKAEERAISSSKGIWRKSPYYGCISSEIDKKDEFLILTSLCGSISLHGWVVKDESRKTYAFPEIEIEKIVLHSSQGEDNKTDLFWNSKKNIWNNDRDSLYVFDENSSIVHYSYYGY